MLTGIFQYRGSLQQLPVIQQHTDLSYGELVGFQCVLWQQTAGTSVGDNPRGRTEKVLCSCCSARIENDQ